LRAAFSAGYIRQNAVAETKQKLIGLAMFVERWILSIVFFCLAAREFTKLWEIFGWHYKTDHGPLVDGIHHVILFALGLFSGALLLIARRPVVPPQRALFIVVPLATTFYTALYYVVPNFPAALRANLAPVSAQKTLALCGLALILAGNFISFWGLLYLRRSFGIYVTVRKIVLNGPYRWVRHPMYLGWIFICAGVALANLSAAYFLLVAGHISLLVYRARLEEKQLAEHDPAYRELMSRTGFLLPKV
jgi:protein-S-isoprenylcysteine O-methyltransferase Ste14